MSYSKLGKGRDAAVAVAEGVMVDRLAEERDFARSGGDEFGDFVDDVLRRAMDFGAASVGDDAIGAEFIAAAGDADVRLGEVIRRGDAAGKIEHFQTVFGGVERSAAARCSLPSARFGGCGVGRR